MKKVIAILGSFLFSAAAFAGARFEPTRSDFQHAGEIYLRSICDRDYTTCLNWLSDIDTENMGFSKNADSTYTIIYRSKSNQLCSLKIIFDGDLLPIRNISDKKFQCLE